MSFFDLTAFQAQWEQIFPLVANPLGGFLNGVTGSIQAP